jgi:type I restriction enzyme S subunit
MKLVGFAGPVAFFVRPSSLINSHFLAYLLRSSGGREKLEAASTGATMNNLSNQALSGFIVPIPPIPVQNRIVAVIDEAFEAIDTAVANTEKSLANARELFDGYLNSVFSQRGKGWIERKLEDTVAKTCSLSYGIVQPGEDVPGGLPVVRPTDLRSKIIGLDGLKNIDPTLADAYKRTKLDGDELLLCVRGGTGSVSIAAKELAGSNVTRGIVPIRFDGSVVNQEFGYFALISEAVQAQIRAATYGAALMQINIRDLKKVTLDVPPLGVQQDLFEKLSNISAEVERLASIYEQKAAALAELKQSILHKAFAGELTAHPQKTLPEAAE